MNLNRSKESHTPLTENKLELKLNIKDLETLQEAFFMDGSHNRSQHFNGEEFVEALSLVLCKGTREEYSDLFDKIDITREGYVDWEKFASHMLLEFYEKDDRTKSSSLPQWKELKTLSGPHKDVIQRIVLVRNLNRYLTISKEGNVGLWGSDCKLQKVAKTHTESCRSRDLWVTDFAFLGNVNKVAVSFTSKEISFYDMNVKLEFNCQVKLENLFRIPICMDYWHHPDNNGEAIMAWGDTGGYINVILWSNISSSLFERVSSKASDKDENTIIISINDIIHGSIKTCTYFSHKAHQDWVRKVSYIPNLECFVSCATNWNTSMVICWMEKYNPSNSTSSEMAGSKDEFISDIPESRGFSRTSCFTVHQGINSFAYNENLNLIATAGVNFQVCLWNPYVISKPNGLLRGHMASVTDVQFNKARGHLISFSKDKILRIWDVQLQVCIQRYAGVFPKGQEMYSKMFYHEEKLRLFITFNFGLTMLEMKPDVKDKISSHEKPLIGCLYNSLYNQVVTACQGGIIYCWMVDTGQRVKTITEICGPQAELTCITQDSTQTRLYTGATDGNVKIWDFNGHCYNTLIVANGNPVDISQIVILKRCVLVFGFSKSITAFWTSSFKDHKVSPSPWKGVQTHKDDILSGASIPPHAVATGSYDGEIIIWNINSEQASRTMTQRSQDEMKEVKKLAEQTMAANAELKRAASNSIQQETDDKLDFIKAEIQNSIANRQIEESITTSTSSEETSTSSSTDTVSDMNETWADLCEDCQGIGVYLKMDVMFNISRLIYLESRKKIKHGGGANLISCGGNGIVRFWNSAEGWLIGEFVAHENASNIIMNTDVSNQYLVTGDMDGYIRVWDILSYCQTESENQKIMSPPTLISQWQSHSDEISGISFCFKFSRTLIITSSADQSAALWELNGVLIGRFGQEHRWKLGSIIETPTIAAIETHEDEVVKQEEDKYKVDPNWYPDPEAIQNPSGYRINTWKDTNLGKDYQELRVRKRERIQPSSIPDLPYLYGEKIGRPTFGPFYSLNISSFEEIEDIEQPEFMEYPEKFFNETEEFLTKTARVPLLNENNPKNVTHNLNTSNVNSNSGNSVETLKAVFDERSLLPEYILEFEHKFRNRFQRHLSEAKVKLSLDDSNSFQEQLPRKAKTVRLKPIQEGSKYQKKLMHKLHIK